MGDSDALTPISFIWRNRLSAADLLFSHSARDPHKVMVQTNPVESSINDHLERSPYPLANPYNGGEASSCSSTTCITIFCKELSLQLVKYWGWSIKQGWKIDMASFGNDVFPQTQSLPESVTYQSDVFVHQYQNTLTRLLVMHWNLHRGFTRPSLSTVRSGLICPSPSDSRSLRQPFKAEMPNFQTFAGFLWFKTWKLGS